MKVRRPTIALALLALAFSVRPSSSATLPEGFQMVRWGMTVDEVRKYVANMNEDLDKFQPNMAVFTSYSFPNNGFSEFRFYKGKLFYIRVKLTNKKANEQIYDSFRSRHGEPLSSDEFTGARRYLWEDTKTSMALYVYPYHAEIRSKSVPISNELASMHQKNDDYDKYLEEMMSRSFSDQSLSIEEKQRLLELKKGLSQDSSK